MEHEYQALKAMERIPIPTPKAYGLDLSGKEIGVPCFFSDIIEGESPREPMLAGELWAEELYLNTVSDLVSVTGNELGNFWIYSSYVRGGHRFRCTTPWDAGSTR